MSEVEILTFASSASATPNAAGNVIVSGSYGGEYNAFHAAKWGIRGVILNDAGVGKANAGINGLPYLDRIGLAAATVDAGTGRIADAEDMLENGIISHVNEAARKLGCTVGQPAAECARAMTQGTIPTESPPEISGGKRFVVSDEPGHRRILCLDAAPMLEADDAGAIAVTGSHAALFRGRPDGLIAPDVFAVFFSDAGVGKDAAGIQRLALLDERGIIAATVSAASASIGNSRSIYEDGVISHVNESARAVGAEPGMRLKSFVEHLAKR